MLAGTESKLLGVRFYAVFDFIGTLFLNALKMLIVPLVVSSIIVGIAGIGSGGAFGRLGLKTLLYYLTTSLLAILVGLVIVNLVAPGMVDGEPAKHLIGLSANASDVVAKVEGKGTGDLVGIFLRMVPTNVMAAAADGQMLGLIFFSLLFGFFMTKIDEAYAESMYNFWQGVFQVMMKITDWVMKFAPIGVFGLVAKVVASTGLFRLCTAGVVLPQCAGGADGALSGGAASAAYVRRARQSAAPLPRHGTGSAHGLFHQFIGGHAAADHGMRGKECRRFQPHQQLCVATRCNGQHGWHGLV